MVISPTLSVFMPTYQLISDVCSAVTVRDSGTVQRDKYQHVRKRPQSRVKHKGACPGDTR